MCLAMISEFSTKHQEKNKCFKCGTAGSLIVHHLSYKPEKTVLCCVSCHVKIHRMLRKEHRCPLSVEETHRISTISSHKRYHKRLMKKLTFHTSYGHRIRFLESLQYNSYTGCVSYSAYFNGDNGKTLHYLGEK